MEQKSIGKFIKKLRKEKNLSQKDLSDIIGVSPKTISKWECCNGMPDITVLEKLSKSLDVNIDELITCQKNNKNRKSKKIQFNIILLLLIIFIITSIILITKTHNNELTNNMCTITRTYYIDNITKSNDENYLYITIHEFQIEGSYTIKLPKIISRDLEINKSYEFIFEATKEYTNVTTDLLFKNSNIINIINTNKEGLERTNSYLCD